MITLNVWRVVAVLGFAVMVGFVLGAWYVVGRIDRAEQAAHAAQVERQRRVLALGCRMFYDQEGVS